MSTAFPGSPGVIGAAGATPPPGGCARARDLILLFALALLLRVAAWALLHESPAVAEESILSNAAVMGDRAAPTPPDQARSPGAVTFYNATAAIFGRDRTILRLANVLLGSLFVPLFLRWAALVVPYRTARIAALLLAVHPELVVFSVTLWNEPLYLVLLFAALPFFEAARRTFGPLPAAVAGALLGLASLTREVGLLAAVLLTLLLLARARRGRTRPALAAALLAMSCAVVILPWSLWISHRAGYPVLITDLNAERFYIGNGPMPPSGWASPGKRIAVLGEAYRELGNDPRERKQAAWRGGLRTIRDELPGGPLRKCGHGLRYLFGLNSFPAGRLLAQPWDRGWAGAWAFHFTGNAIDRRDGGNLLAGMTLGFHALFLVGGAAGIALGVLRGSPGVAGALAAAHVVPPLVTLSCSRYRLPVLPLLALGCAALLAGDGARWEEASGRRRAMVIASAGLAAGLLAVSWSGVFPPQYG